jgi:hypothetical protein
MYLWLQPPIDLICKWPWVVVLMITRCVKCSRAWRAWLYVHKQRWTVLTKDIHTINDDKTWMRIYIQLDGTFSQFPTWSLTLDGQERSISPCGYTSSNKSVEHRFESQNVYTLEMAGCLGEPHSVTNVGVAAKIRLRADPWKGRRSRKLNEPVRSIPFC